MPYEIERKFLVKGNFKEQSFKKLKIKQGYLSLAGSHVVRIRIKGEKAYLTVKSSMEENSIVRREWEYEVPVQDAEEMFQLCDEGIIDKTRYLIKAGSHIFEVDEFFGENKGLLIAEVELKSEDEPFEKPDWLGEEVTGNVRYYNSFLSMHPYKDWS